MKLETVDRLFAAALDLPAAERHALLESEPDEGVREATRRLLGRHDALTTNPVAAGFLAGLDLELAAQLMDTESADSATIGRFTIVRRLGTGATGVVYLAHDPELGRDVAIKLLATDLGSDPRAEHRFTEEARAASGVDHPHVVTVFETGRTADNRLFIVMAYHEGETLRRRIANGALPVDEALRIAAEVCDGLASAHAKGVVHCDIKPENILLTARGAKIVDFGIARFAGGAASGAGFGTAAYMSPEQIRGSDVDHRTDVWSLGVVLHEMLTGTRPFCADRREELVHAIRYGMAPPLPAEVPPSVTTILDRSLAKQPSARYQTADEVLASLRAATVQVDAAPGAARPRATGRRIAALVGGLAALTAVAWALWPERSAGSEAPAPAIAILPFRAAGPDVQYLGEGMVDLLSFAVEGTPGFRKIDPATVITAWRAFRGDTTPEIDEVGELEIAHTVRARYLITGGVVQLGNEVRMIAAVHDVETGRQRGLAQVTGPLGDVPELVDRLLLELLQNDLLPSDGPSLPNRLSAITTTSLPALKAYLAGEHEYRITHWREAAGHYARALEHDSAFALALYRAIKANAWGAGVGATQSYLERLAPLVERLPERDRMLITGDLGELLWPGEELVPLQQIETLEAMLRRYPDDAEGWTALGDRYYHDRGPLLLPPETYRRAFRMAIELNPNFREPYLHLIEDAFSQRDSAAAQRLAERVSAIDRGIGRCSYRLAYDLTWGSPAERRRALVALDTIPSTTVLRECLPTTVPIPAPAEVRAKLDTIYRRIADAALTRVPPFGAFLVLRLHVLVPHGQLAALRRELESLEGRTLLADAWPERWQLALHLSSFPDSVAAHRAALTLSRSTHPVARFWVGLLAIEEQRWSDADRTGDWFDQDAAARTAAGDREGARAAASHAAALRAYRKFLLGRTTDLKELEAAVRRLPVLTVDQPQAVIRYLTGRLLLDRGELGEAERYFLSFGQIDHLGTLAGFQLARIAERQGRRAEAAERYHRFLAWWQDADPALQPLAEEARRWLGRNGAREF